MITLAVKCDERVMYIPCLIIYILFNFWTLCCFFHINISIKYYILLLHHDSLLCDLKRWMYKLLFIIEIYYENWKWRKLCVCIKREYIYFVFLLTINHERQLMPMCYFIFREGGEKNENYYEIGLTEKKKPPNQHYANVWVGVCVCVLEGLDSNRFYCQKGWANEKK